MALANWVNFILFLNFIAWCGGAQQLEIANNNNNNNNNNWPKINIIDNHPFMFLIQNTRIKDSEIDT
jgi:hypothetical protein